jgi:16S rRNA (uracil1498-N3)-methyltransferase
MDLIVRQAAEAGVGSIMPLVSERSLGISGDFRERVARWKRIAREALQQSGNTRMPDIGEPRSLADAAAGRDWDLGLFFHQERLDGGTLHEVLWEGPARVALLIGPEGGLSDREVELLRGCGFRAVFLGGAVLRTETAAVYAIAAVKTVLQERQWWTQSRRG